MGGSSSTLALQNNIFSETLNETFENCGTTCDSQTGETINIIRGDVSGNFVGAAAECKANSTCVISNGIDTQVETVISNVLTQSNTSVADLMGMFSSENNLAEIQTNITNLITQIVATACNANAIDETSPTFNYLSSSATIGGNYLGAVATGDATNYCTLTNMSKIASYNQVQNQVDQSNVSVGLMGVIFGAIILIAGIAFILILVMIVGIGGIAGVKAISGGKSKQGQAEGESAEDQAVDAAMAELDF